LNVNNLLLSLVSYFRITPYKRMRYKSFYKYDKYSKKERYRNQYAFLALHLITPTILSRIEKFENTLTPTKNT